MCAVAQVRSKVGLGWVRLDFAVLDYVILTCFTDLVIQMGNLAISKSHLQVATNAVTCEDSDSASMIFLLWFQCNNNL